jgi:redox-sensitive bicupin YhaK (pirin superfamily)
MPTRRSTPACSTPAKARPCRSNPARKAYVHVVRGSLTVNGQTLQKGDAAMLANESNLTLADGHDAEVLVFDLAP